MRNQQVPQEPIEQYGILRPQVGNVRPSNILLNWLLDFLMLSRTPRLRRWSRWDVERGWARGMAGWVLRAALLFGMDSLLRAFARRGREFEEFRQRMTDELGRDPSDEELMRAWGEAHGYEWPPGE